MAGRSWGTLGLGLAFFSSAESFFSYACNYPSHGVQTISGGDGAVRPGWGWCSSLIRSVPKPVELNRCKAQRERCELGKDSAYFCFCLSLFCCRKLNGIKSLLKLNVRVWRPGC